MTFTDFITIGVLGHRCNVASPHPVTNTQFAKTLARVLDKPQFLVIPAPVARIMLGKLADALLLSSIRAEPGVLLDSGFVFDYPELKQALTEILKQKPESPAQG